MRHPARLTHLTVAGESVHAPVRAGMEDAWAGAKPRHSHRDLRRRSRDPVRASSGCQCSGSFGLAPRHGASRAVAGITPGGVMEIDVEYETPGLKDEGMYWKVFVLRDSSFLSGFIPTEDFEDAR